MRSIILILIFSFFAFLMLLSQFLRIPDMLSRRSVNIPTPCGSLSLVEIPMIGIYVVLIGVLFLHRPR